MFEFVKVITFNLASHLGQEGIGHSIYYYLYAVAGSVIFLAMLNALLAVFVVYSAAMKRCNIRLIKISKYLTISSLSVQIILGFSPIVIMFRGIYKDVEVSLWTYGMPLFQLAVIIFCVFYQCKIIGRYNLLAKVQSKYNESSNNK